MSHKQSCDFTANIKPEIGKVRPVVIIKPHKRDNLAIIVPFTTQTPNNEVDYTVEIPLGIMPGKLQHNQCWALCDMIHVINIKRLSRIYRQPLDKIFISKEYFDKIISVIHKTIGNA